MKSLKGTRSLKSIDSKKQSSLGATESRGKPALKSNWTSIVIACGSNSFNQCNLDLELNSTNFVYSNVPPYDQDVIKTIAISCGTNLSAAIVQTSDGSNTCYAWGSGGLPGAQLRVPTPIGNFRVSAVSCGQDHIAFITADGQAFTWGCGDHGMLGHGNKQAVTAPKFVAALKDMICLDISCGGYHTSFIAAPLEQLSAIHLPRENSQDPGRMLHGGCLYSCGQTKAGQLGLGQLNRPSVPTPTKVTLSGGCKVATKVSCGFHHTAVVGWNNSDGGDWKAIVMCCGWNEYGRLGVGDEEQRFELSTVSLPESCLPVLVASGEQHTIALSHDGQCYAWGNNCSGQLGLGNPSSTPQSLVPAKVPVPEGMVITSIACGGRHSAAITRCGKLLSWGWNEEGQLGHGSEKNAYLPRPCRIPRIESEIGSPVAVSAGMSHTLVIVRNEHHEHVIPIEKEVEQPTLTEEKPRFWIPEHVESDEDEAVVAEEIVVAHGHTRKQAIVANDDDDNDVDAAAQDDNMIPPQVDLEPVRSVRELLRMRDDQSNKPTIFVTANTDADSLLSIIGAVAIEEEPNISKDDDDEDDNHDDDEVLATYDIAAEDDQYEFHNDIDEDQQLVAQEATMNQEIEEEEEENLPEPVDLPLPMAPPSPLKMPQLAPRPLPKQEPEKTAIFYKMGQDFDRCLVANSARRAEIRKAKKQTKS